MVTNARTQSDVRRNSSPIVRFLLNQFRATVGAILVGLAMGYILSMLPAVWADPAPGLPYWEVVMDQKFFRLSDNPYFILPSIAAVVLGILSQRRGRDRAALWAWCLPTIALLAAVMSFRSWIGPATGHDIRENFFGRGCEANECGYQVLVTAPFYTSVCYSLGAMVALAFRRRPASNTQNQTFLEYGEHGDKRDVS